MGVCLSVYAQTSECVKPAELQNLKQPSSISLVQH